MSLVCGMNLAELARFELDLVQPCMAITSRGLPVDDAKRRSMLEWLEEEAEPIAKEIEERAIGAIVGDSLKGGGKARLQKLKKWHLFDVKWTCKCCRGGSKKSQACWSCAGLEKAPSKNVVLMPCRVCEGEAKGTNLEFNASSTEQIRLLLYEVLRLPKRFRKKTLCVDEDKLKSLVSHDKSGIVTRLLSFGRLDTIQSIFRRIAPGEDGKIRTFLNVAGTETGRLSSSEGFLEVSTNLQNLPKKVAAKSPRYDVRRCIVPLKGYAFVEADLSQAEARVVAALSHDDQLFALWTQGVDIHKWTAAQIFNCDEVNVTKDQRFLGKRCRHAFGYGMGVSRFVETVNEDSDLTGVSLHQLEGKRIHKNYHKLTPKLELWWSEVHKKIGFSPSLTTVWGRKRTFFGRRSESTYSRGSPTWLDPVHKEAIAYVPQSTVADLLNMGMLSWWREWDGKMGELSMQVHDSVLLRVPLAKVAVAARLLRKCLTIPMRISGYDVTIPADVSWSEKSWGEMEEMEL